MKSFDRKFILRLRWLFFLMVPFVALVLVANLFQIQVIHGSNFREQADNQYVSATYNSFERGTIYFQEKNNDLITAAGQKKGYKLTINPTKVVDPELLYEKINAIVPLDDKDNFIQRASSDREYYEVIGELSSEQAKELKGVLGRQVQLYSEKWRTYPLGGIASHVLGFLGFQGDDYAGRYGLEREYEDVLVRNNQDLYTNFFARVFHGVQEIVESEVVPEGDVVTTIEPQVQIFLENNLETIHEKWDSELTGGIIMHPKTGNIYALAATPDFDPNNFSSTSINTFRNPLVENVYEMGSIIKPLVVALAWDAGDIDENTQYNDTGSVVVGPHTINNFDMKGRGLVDVQEILNQSLNTGMVYISKQVQKDTFRDYFQKYGFGEPTGIDLPNDIKGLTSNLKSNRDIEFANMSFGQGIAMTPMAVVKATSALANNGKTVVPRVVDRINYSSGLFDRLKQKKGVQVISAETAEDISRMMVNVFDEYNEGATRIPNYSVAAKTGTAQIPGPNGGYYDDRNLHSFIGYFPAYEPEFMVFLYTVHPKGVKYASQTLLNPFRDITQYLINYYNIPPDR